MVPATTGVSGRPTKLPPVCARSGVDVRAASASHSAYARRSSGTYSGDSKYAWRMMRVRPRDEPRACAGPNCSMPSTRCPRAAACAATALPIAPSPRTTVSYRTRALAHDDGARGPVEHFADDRRRAEAGQVVQDALRTFRRDGDQQAARRLRIGERDAVRVIHAVRVRGEARVLGEVVARPAGHRTVRDQIEHAGQQRDAVRVERP